MSSIELFHSNFWNWMFNKYKESITFFFEDIATFEYVKKVECKREYNNFDIYLEDNQTCYIIENKIKSLPDMEQLKKYTDKVNKNVTFQRGIIASIVKEGFQNLEQDKKWVELDYQEIASSIKRFHDDYILKRADYDRFDFDLINRYQNMISKISMLVQNELKEASRYVTYSESLQSIGFGVVYKKLLGSILRRRFFACDEFIKWEDYFHNGGIDYRINNSKLTFQIQLNSTEKGTYIGIQIEDYDYRWFIITDYSTKRLIREDQKEEIAKQYYQEAKTKYNQWLIDGNHQGRRGKEFGRYVTDNYSFVYHKQAPITPGISFDDLIQRVIRDIELLHDAGYIMKKEK